MLEILFDFWKFGGKFQGSIIYNLAPWDFVASVCISFDEFGEKESFSSLLHLAYLSHSETGIIYM